MTISVIVLVIVLFCFIVASYVDIKKREVYDYINYSFAFLIIAIAIFDSILNSSFEPVKYVGFGLLVGFAIGSILYYMGIWGGGDAKFLIGFSASSYYLIDLVTKDSYFHSFSNMLGFVFKFLFFSFIVGGVLAILLLFFCFIKNFRKISFSIKRKEKFILLSIFLIGMILGLLYNFSFFTTLFFVPLYLFLKAAKQLEKLIFVKNKRLKDIVLGDWIVQDIKYNGNLIYEASDFKLGVDERQLEKIKELAKKDDKLKLIYVKDGIAFLPPLFVGFLIMLFI